MQFFDAWRIVSTMSIDPLDDDDLESFDGVLPPREKWELKAQSVDRTDAQLLREQHLQARAQNKSSAQMAAEIAQVHLLTTLLADRAELLSDLACARQGYMDNVKTRTSAGADPFSPPATVDETSVPATSGDQCAPMEIDETGRDATSASSSAARVSMDVDAAAQLLRERRPSPESLPMISWQRFLCFRMTGH